MTSTGAVPGPRLTRALVCGWFSVDGGEATVGDLESMAEVRDTLRDAGVTVDVATNDGFSEGLALSEVRPEAYDRLVFVCGPLHGNRVAALLDRFPHARAVAVNVSVVDDELARRFDQVVPRDSADTVNPDLALARPPPPLPVVGVVRAHPEPEYDAARHGRVDEAVRLALASRPCAAVEYDTRVHPAADPLGAHARTPQEVAALAGRMDAVVTTRLHGMVVALGQGTPVVAIDPIEGGAKVARQAEALAWPCRLLAEEVDSEQVSEALAWCLTEEARDRAARVVGAEASRLSALRRRVIAAVTGDEGPTEGSPSAETTRGHDGDRPSPERQHPAPEPEPLRR